MHEYLVIYERSTDGGWGAYVPDLPGLGVVGDTRGEVELLIRDGMRIHVAGLIEDGLPVPEPASSAAMMTVAA